MAAALLFGAGQILVNQAAVSAVLLATLGTPSGSSSFTRFFSALIGCGIAVLVGPVLFRRDPLRTVGKEAERVLDRLADALDEVAEALAAGDPDAAHDALESARAADGEVDAYEDALAAADESLRLAPAEHARPAQARGLLRGAGAGRLRDPQHARARPRRRDGRRPRRPGRARARGGRAPARPRGAGARRRPARAAARTPRRAGWPAQAAAEATAVLDRRSDLAANLIVAQVRSTAADILRSAGMDTEEMRAALGPYPGPEPAREEG